MTERETWEAYARRQLEDPGSAIRQLMDVGISRDVAFLVHFLGRLYEQQEETREKTAELLGKISDGLADIAALLETPEDEWRKGMGG